MRIAFRSNQLCERGTEVAMYDYAVGNEELLGNESIIISQTNENPANLVAYQKFKDRFPTFLYENGNNEEMERLLRENNVDAMYNICHGMPEDNLSKIVPNLIHCVFDCSYDKINKNTDRQAAICSYLSNKYTNGAMPFVPHIIQKKVDTDSNLRDELGIPEDAIVIGRLGGQTTFNIQFVHDVIESIANEYDNIYWLFMNTLKFCNDQENIIHLPMSLSDVEKAKFINTCDAMIHARREGEIFSVALGEFSIRNKPIFTFSDPLDTGHFDLFGDRIIEYSDSFSLYHLITNFDFELSKKIDWDVYKDKYNDINVMNKFKEVFLDQW